MCDIMSEIVPGRQSPSIIVEHARSRNQHGTRECGTRHYGLGIALRVAAALPQHCASSL